MLKQDVLIKPRAAQYEQFCQTALSLLFEAGIKGGSIWVLDRPKPESSILQGLEGEHGFFSLSRHILTQTSCSLFSKIISKKIRRKKKPILPLHQLTFPSVIFSHPQNKDNNNSKYKFCHVVYATHCTEFFLCDPYFVLTTIISQVPL